MPLSDACNYNTEFWWSEIYDDLLSGERDGVRSAVSRLEKNQLNLEDNLRNRGCSRCKGGVFHLGSNQTLTASTWTTVELDETELNCDDTPFTLASNQVTVNQAGDYLVGGNVQFNDGYTVWPSGALNPTDGTSTWGTPVTSGVRVRREDGANNGSGPVCGSTALAPEDTNVEIHYSCSQLISLAKDDIIRLEAYSDYSGGATVNGGDDGQGVDDPTYLWLSRVCACGTAATWTSGT